tara:strand:+ start:624 stop:836 length:213 start_codon:yes stop_codon:yes gene_type:complete
VSIGSKMKKNLLFRCAKLSTLNEQDIRVLENLNPHAIIDFRDPKEVKMAPITCLLNFKRDILTFQFQPAL